MKTTKQDQITILNNAINMLINAQHALVKKIRENIHIEHFYLNNHSTFVMQQSDILAFKNVFDEKDKLSVATVNKVRNGYFTPETAKLIKKPKVVLSIDLSHWQLGTSKNKLLFKGIDKLKTVDDIKNWITANADVLENADALMYQSVCNVLTVFLTLSNTFEIAIEPIYAKIKLNKDYISHQQVCHEFARIELIFITDTSAEKNAFAISGLTFKVANKNIVNVIDLK